MNQAIKREAEAVHFNTITGPQVYAYTLDSIASGLRGTDGWGPAPRGMLEGIICLVREAGMKGKPEPVYLNDTLNEETGEPLTWVPPPDLARGYRVEPGDWEGLADAMTDALFLAASQHLALPLEVQDNALTRWRIQSDCVILMDVLHRAYRGDWQVRY